MTQAVKAIALVTAEPDEQSERDRQFDLINGHIQGKGYDFPYVVCMTPDRSHRFRRLTDCVEKTEAGVVVVSERCAIGANEFWFLKQCVEDVGAGVEVVGDCDHDEEECSAVSMDDDPA